MTRALVIVDHGSRRAEAHAHLEWLASEVRRRAPGLRVYPAHMELAAPSIADAIDACVRDGADEVAVHPCFIVPGRHLAEDIPALIEAARRRHPRVEIRQLDALGTRPELAELILATLDHSS